MLPNYSHITDKQMTVLLTVACNFTLHSHVEHQISQRKTLFFMTVTLVIHCELGSQRHHYQLHHHYHQCRRRCHGSSISSSSNNNNNAVSGEHASHSM